MSEHREHLLPDTEDIYCRGALTVGLHADMRQRFYRGQDRLVLGRHVGGAEIRPLLVHELLAQDVRVAAVLSELAQRMEVDPAQRERAAPVAVDHVVQP